MHLWCALSELQLGLRHGDALSHRENVGVRDRQHIDAAVKVLFLDVAALAGHIVGVVIRQVLAKALGQQRKLQLLAVVHALVDRRHDRAALFEQSNRGAHGSILVAVTNLHVGDAGQATTRVHARAHERKQGLAGLFVGQRQD